jgi:serine/threonine protein kinase
LTLENWLKVEELFHRAAECDREERIRLLDEAGRTDPGLRQAVESLLACEPGAAEHLRAAISGAADANCFTLVGQMVSHYRILEGLGSGGMGVVYKAQDAKLPRFVALKFLPEDLPEDRALRERFKREAYAASALNHPNICTVHELGEHEGHLFIAMELLEGETLRERISAPVRRSNGAGLPLPMDELLNLAMQIAEGLEAAHTKGITHRDVKPANLFLTASGQLKILDFGIAKFQIAEPSKLTTETAANQTLDTSIDESLTSAGAVIGTVAYMSPEQLSGLELDSRSDLFSFGAVLYEMATGVAPFQRETSALMRDAILNEEPLSPARLNLLVTAELDRIIVKALEKDRQRRYQSAAGILVDLRSLLEAQPRRPVRMRVLLLASALLVLAAVGSWFLIESRSETSSGMVERQITANPPENWVSGGAVSPDGKTIAYHDQTGLYLRSADTGETRQLSLSPSIADRLVYLTWFADGKKLLAPIFSEASYMWNPDMWTISTVDDAAPRFLLRDFLEGSVSPDGRSIVLLSTRGLSIAPVNGGPRRTLKASGGRDLMFSPVWSPDGRWIAYLDVWWESGTQRQSIVVQPATGGPAKTVVSETNLPAADTLCYGAFTGLCLSWSPDWRLVFSTAPAEELRSTDTGFGLWTVPLRPDTGEAAGNPKRLAHWTDFGPANPSVSANGKRLSFLKAKGWEDVYLAELNPEGTIKNGPRRFTLDDRGSSPNGWTPDSQAIVFSSIRAARRAIFEQALRQPVAQAVVQSSDDDCEKAVFTPDRSWMLFRETKYRLGHDNASPALLMRRPAAGGRAETILQEPADMQWSYECGTKPGSSCVLSQLEQPKRPAVVFYSLDPLRGRGAKLGQFSHLTDFSGHSGWSLSPDGSRIAYVTKQGQIEMMSLNDRVWHEISLPASWQQLQTAAWAADGKSLFVTCWQPDSSDLLQVKLNGKVTRLWHNGHSQWQWVANPLPSPDGKYLALQVRAWDSNVWLLENF